MHDLKVLVIILVVFAALAFVPYKLLSSKQMNDNMGVLNVPLKYYAVLSLLVYLTYSNLRHLADKKK